MSDRIQKIIDNLLDEAVKAASQSEWAEVARICGEIINIDGDNAEAVQLLKAAEANLQKSSPQTTTSHSTSHTASKQEPSAERSIKELQQDALERNQGNPQIPVMPQIENTTRSDFIDLADRAKWAKITIRVTLIASAISLFISIYAIYFYNVLTNWDSLDFAKRFDFAGSGITPWWSNSALMSRLATLESFQGFMWLFFAASFITSGVMFLIWLRAASKNLPHLEPSFLIIVLLITTNHLFLFLLLNQLLIYISLGLKMFRVSQELYFQIQ